jgi:CRISPR/Cas system-associated exonuclease Cas4 (RecB family)
MNFFLEEIARHLYSTYADKLKDCCVVFPNRRAGLFFNKYLSALADKPIWSPRIFTINDLMVEMSNLEPADELDILFELYDIYCQEKHARESFDDFYFWGEIMISDFNDIDKYLVDASDLFRNISELRSIEDQFAYLTEEQIRVIRRFWQSFESDRLSKHKDEFMDTWRILYPVYSKLRKKLGDHKTGYEGMIYRDVAENPDKDNLMSIPVMKFFFIGFNALNECEKVLFKHLALQRMAEFYWDYDDYYLKNKNHEAGRFIRHNISQFGSVEMDVIRNSLSEKKNIRVISVPSAVGQAKMLPELLADVNNISHETAVVLADEELLLPVLHSLPESIGEYNITMGYPVNETPVYSLIEHIIDLQNNCRKYNDQQWRFYHRDVLLILNHPLIYQGTGSEINVLITGIISKNKIYITDQELGQGFLLSSIFKKVDEVNQIPDYLLNILEILARSNIDQDHNQADLENEVLFQLYIRIKRLKGIIDKSNIHFNTRTLYRLLRKSLMNTRIPFSGEPLAGLQIMGVLETRGLDFRNLIILSMNEDIFPGSPVSHSFLPHHLRYGFNLPTLEHQDAIYAYYFYRLIQRAENIHLLYNSKSEELSKGEKSRFIHQLSFDPAFSLNERVIAYNIQANPERPLIFHKDRRIGMILNEYISGAQNKRFLSPSALNVYLDCGLRFYFRYIAQLEEPEEITEEVDQLLFGNMLHAAINKLYQSFGSLPITAESLDKLLKNKQIIDRAIRYAFQKEYHFSEDINKVEIQGRNVIIREIIKQYLMLIIKTDKTYTPFRIVHMEKEYTYSLPVRNEDNAIQVEIGGKIDRVDHRDHEIRIIDYKTGRIDRKISSLDDLFDRTQKNRNHAVFQTLLYAKLFYHSGYEPEIAIVPGLYPIRELNSNDFDYHLQAGSGKKKEKFKDYRNLDDIFTEKLRDTIQEIFNPAIGFHPTNVVENCKYCPYRSICHR